MFHSQNNPEKDNQLADFTDRVLEGRMKPPASNADEELISLEKTILRLSSAFPPEPLDDTRAKQMLARLKARVRREDEERAAAPAFWKRLFDFQSNPQVGLIFAVAAAVILAVVVLPADQPPGSSTSGTAFSNVSFVTAAGLIGVLLVLYWISRRK